MPKLTIVVLALMLALAGPAAPAEIRCITANTIDGSSDPLAANFSGTALRVRGGNLPGLDLEVFSSDDAFVDPVTCDVGGTITCAGWDTDGAAEVYKKCQRNAPWRQVSNTGTITAATAFFGLEDSDCLYALKITDTGTTGSVCLHLAVTSERSLIPTNAVEDGSEIKPWSELVP